MAEAIAGIIAGQPSFQPQQVVVPKEAPREVIPQSKADLVTISAEGKQAVQLVTAGSTPAEESKEPPIEKAREALVGKK